ncbi:MAG: Nif3-like dinuclear metal center hexameric protein [Fibrobacteres bacterium CG2_30_45_31]|nr:MAG: Nif3-like dinuclear metal center hexameric protein [Fibrobacteres bacterium CG2_30_45_31]
MQLAEFSRWLGRILTPEKFKDYCPNGLCVEANSQVTHVLTGVSFRESLVDEAIRKGADCIIVHHPHGFWNNDNGLPIGIHGRKIQNLMQHNINLFGFHLPLDGQVEFGNNAQIAKLLGVQVNGGFMKEGEGFVGCLAAFSQPISVPLFMERLDQVFDHGVQQSFFFGKESIQTLAICSGGGASGIPEAISLGVDAYVTGEIKENTPIFVEEAKFNLVTCGHHRTEIFGVRALAKKIEEDLNIRSAFVDLDNPI